MFKNPAEEAELIMSLKCTVEEWGPDAITVHLPVSWFNPEYTLGDRVKLAFDTVNTAEIQVTHGITNYKAKVVELAQN